jgi:pimeloyl-ACP methyl ester carboxylesterase
MAYPFLVLLGLLLLSGLGGTAAAWIASTLVAAPTIPPLAGVAAAALVLFALIRWTERYTYMLYLFDDIASTHQFVYGDRPDWEERFEIFAGYLIDAAKSAAVDEIVVVGHSSGSFIAVEVVGRALARDPDLGRHGPQVSVLTVGANMPIVGFNPVAETFRQRLRRLAIDPDVRWIEYQSRRDVMNFYLFDPIAGHGLELGTERRNPTVMPVVFRHLVLPENYPSFRWHFFRVHFQFVMANQTPAAYDFYMMVCGPFPLPLRAAHPDEVLAAVAGDRAAAQAAWESLRFRMPAGNPPENGPKTGVEQAGDTD